MLPLECQQKFDTGQTYFNDSIQCNSKYNIICISLIYLDSTNQYKDPLINGHNLIRDDQPNMLYKMVYVYIFRKTKN